VTLILRDDAEHRVPRALAARFGKYVFFRMPNSVNLPVKS
jgi:hypothetical protein